MSDADKKFRWRLDYLVPEWHFQEDHSLEIGAPTEQVMAAVQQVTWNEARVARTLMGVTKTRIRGERRIIDDLHQAGGGAFKEVTGDEVVFAGLSTLNEPLKTQPGSAEEFREFDLPGHTKSALNIRYEKGRLTVESRLYCTDQPTYRSFRPYWYFIRLPSGQVRQSLLRAIFRRVHKSA